MIERKRKLNCGNTIAEIRREKKFAIVAIKLSINHLATLSFVVCNES